MSNTQVPAIFSQALPGFLAGKSREELARLNDAAANGTGGTGTSINRISLKQSRFRLIVGGEEKAVIQQSFLDVVLVRANEGLNKAFYLKDWNPNDEPKAPDCYSEDGVRPAANCQSKQAATCAECPQNQWGSKINALTKAKIKACSDSKCVAVLPPTMLSGDMYQLKIPAASMKDFGSFLKLLNTAQTPVPYYALVTRVAFDTSVSFPKLTFEPVRYLTDAEYQEVMAAHESDEAREVCGSGTAGLPPAPAVAQPVTVQPSPSQVQQPTQQQPVDPFAVGAAQTQQPAAQAQQQPVDPFAAGTAQAQQVQQAAATPAPTRRRRAPAAAAQPAAAQPAAAATAPAAAQQAFDAGNPFAGAGEPQQQQAAAPAQTGATIDNSTGQVVAGNDVDAIFGGAGWPV